MRLITVVLAGWLITFSSAGYALDLYVVVDGNDAWTGQTPLAAKDSDDGLFATLDTDEDVDSDDFIIFEKCMSGANSAAAPSCDPR